MTEYLILIVIMAVIYFVLIRNKPAVKTDWESLPLLTEYEQIKEAKNDQGERCCQYCGHTETIERSLKSDKENADKTKFYHACTGCKVVLWRSEIMPTEDVQSKK